MKRNRHKPCDSDLEKLTHLFKQGLFAEAEQLATTLTSRFPNHGVAWKVKGVICLESNRLEEGLPAAKRAVELLSNDAAVYNNLGNIYFKLEQCNEAESNFRKALAIAPDYAKALFNLASLLRFDKKLEESEDCCRRALEVNPHYTNAHIALGQTLELQGRLPEARASYKAALILAPDMAALHTDILHLMSLDVDTTQEQLLAEHLAFGDHFETRFRGMNPNHANIKDPIRQLEIGFVTGDLNNHALANYLEPFFEFLVQKPLLALHIYYTKNLEDEVTQRFKAHLPIWNVVSNLSEDELAGKIRADGIDILIDLAGHTVFNRLMTFARKPAPLQVSWLGYLGTTGMQAMDYFVADAFWVPPGKLDWQFTEKMAYLPAAMIFQPNALASAINELPALTTGKITFGSFNRYNKINDAVIVLWSMLMHKVPDSCMVLVAIPEQFQERVIQGFGQAGVDRSRLTFFGHTPQIDYLTLHQHVDFCLDTYPHGGGATTAHAAWMGVPTLCLIGDTPASRFGATEMHHLGLDGFIATSIEEFIEKGCYWAANTEELNALRQSMRVRFNESALGQHRAFADNFEAMLRAMWSRWCDDLPAEPLQIYPVKENPMNPSSATQFEPTVRELDSLQALNHQRQFKEAETLARKLVSQYPEHGFAWKILGSVLHELGQREESLAIQIKITDMRPDDHEAHFNLACEYHQQGKLDESVRSYVRALGIQPNNALAYLNMSAILKTMGLATESEMYSRQAIAIRPDMATAHNNLGNALQGQGRLIEAQASYEHSLVLQPDNPDTLNNLAITLKDQGHWREANDTFRRALKIKPEWAAAHSNLLYCMSHDVHIEPHTLHAEHLAFGDAFEKPLRDTWQPHTNAKEPYRILQIGFVSADFYDHALTNFLEPVFEALSQKPGLVMHAYYTHIIEDAANARMKKHFTHWHGVSHLAPGNLATQIRADGIDILFDLTGHTAHNRLLTFARKPAPIQVSWLGYLGTTGLQAIDFYLCDKFWVPAGELDWQFTEKMAYLPSAMAFQPSEQAPAINALPALVNGHITFGSFNRPNKLNESVIILWSMLLREVPNARMVLGGIPLDSEETLRQIFAHEGIAQDRLTFFSRSNLVNYLTLHHQVDLCVDSFPYGGGATTANAAWMGVPTLSLAGETPPSRFGSAMTHQLGLDGFIATDIDDFIAKGRHWAENLQQLASIRTGLRERFSASPLGQPAQLAEHLEKKLRLMWQSWCHELPPVTEQVEPDYVEIAPATQREPLAHDLDALVDLYSHASYAEAAALAHDLTGRFPEHATAWKILGATYQNQERYEESLPATQRAIALLPKEAVNHNNLGVSLFVLKRLGEAEGSFRKAIDLQPGYGKALVNLGATLLLQDQPVEAQACCEKAIAIDPADAGAHIGLGNALEAQGMFSEAQASYYRADMAHEPRRAVAHSNVLYLLTHDVLTDARHLFSEHVAFGEDFEKPLRQAWEPHTNSKEPNRPLQIGFVSGDLNHHALANFLEPVFQHLASKPSLVLHAYRTNKFDDPVTARMRSFFAQWHDVAHFDDIELDQKIRADQIDILIDVSGHTKNNRLLTFARKPAPVQASWLGYLGTTGLKSVDYYISDTYWIPSGELDWQFVEKMAYLPSAVTFKPSVLSPPVSSLPALKHGALTFGSFNRANKINSSVIALWSMLLRSIPSSCLLLGAVEIEAQEAMLQSFAAENITKDRLAFCPRLATADYLALHHEVDICLDTFPHAGGATTANAAWMGVPTLGLAGQTPASRFSATLMHQLGLDDFVAGSIEEFVHIGRYWAKHLGELSQLRASMRQRFASSLLGQPGEFANAFESMLRTMWQGWCKDEVVQSFAIEHSKTASTNHMARADSIPPDLPSVVVVSASKLSESDFWAQSALGLSLQRLIQQGEIISTDVAFENAHGLPVIFNAALERAQDNDVLVFVHDDVWIDEYNFSQQVAAGLQQFDVIGVAGNKHRLPNQPAWCFVDQQFTWDEKSNLSGQVGHGVNAFGQLADFGEVPATCELLDGVFLAARKSTLTANKVQFDLQFDFHFYDMDFCRSARKAGLRLGTWCINLTHQSGGSFGTLQWVERYQIYLKKWEVTDSYTNQSYTANGTSKLALPLVSIIIPTHNRPDYLEIALKSALDQTYKNIEIIISDNGDDLVTQERIAPYLDKYSHITYYRKQGMSAMENGRKCFELSTGEYINPLMDDDIFHPEKIERMMHYYLNYPDIGLVTSFRQLIDEHGNHLAQSRGFEQLFPIDTLVSGTSFGHRMLSNDLNLIGEPTTVLVRRSDVHSGFGIFEGRNYTVLSDVATWLSIIAKRDFVYISDPLSYLRIHSGQDQRNSNTQLTGALEWFGFLCDAYKGKLFLHDRSEFLGLLARKLRGFSGYITARHEEIRIGDYMLDEVKNVLSQGFEMLLDNTTDKNK